MIQSNGVKIEDIYRLKFVSDPQLSPNGHTIAYVVKGINAKENYESSIYLLDVESGQSIQWTSGTSLDTYPRWSPDGESILFLSNRSGKTQVWTISSMGGEPKQLTFAEMGVSSPSWHPDGSTVLYNFTDAKETSDTPQPVVIDTLRYKADGEDSIPIDYQQIACISIQNQDVKVLTQGPADHLYPSWTPDGSGFVCAQFIEDTPGSYRQSTILLCELDNKPKRVSEIKGTLSYPICSPDGRFIAYIGHNQRYKAATYNDIWVYDRIHNATHCLTEKLDIQIGDMMISDLQTVERSHLSWNRNSETLYFLASEFGNTELYEIDLYGNVDKIVEGDRHIFQYAMDDESRHVYLAVSTPSHPGDIVFHDVNSLKQEPVTSHNESFLSNITLSVPEPVQFPSQDGTVIHGWLLKPNEFTSGEKYPLVLEIHGGPHMMYGNTFFHEFQVLTSKGYAVLYLNPRGSHGYGQAFVDGCRGDYGGGDYRDLMAGVDYTLESYAWTDSEQLFVTGGSYGGFMTNWIVGNTNRFRAAVTQRSICNWLSFYGVSDIGYFFTEGEIGAHMENNPDKLWYHSPLRLVKDINTPLLILHGEKDYRCPIEQAEQLFVALKQQEKTVRFVRFPDADHNLSRTGDPEMRIARLQQICSWFNQFRLTDKSIAASNASPG